MLKKFLLSGLLVLFTASMGWAAPYQCITDNGNNCAALAPQLSVGIADVGGLPQFTIGNAGPIASSITGAYWDDDYNLLAGIYTLTGIGASVVFAPGGTPPILPSQNTAIPQFQTDSSLTATSQRSGSGPGTIPPVENGIGPGEALEIIFNLESGVTYAQVLAAFNSGNLRSGIHVQSIGTAGGSDSLVNMPGTGQVIPEPATILLLGSGLIGFWAFRRKLRK